jgi:hypothetical protein
MGKLSHHIAIAGFLWAAIAVAAPYPALSETTPLKPRQTPAVFAPNCAGAPRCAAHVCARRGRCKLGSQLQNAGCLLYTCRRGAS